MCGNLALPVAGRDESQQLGRRLLLAGGDVPHFSKSYMYSNAPLDQAAVGLTCQRDLRALGQDRPRSRDQDRRSRDGDGQQEPQGPERFGHRYGELSRRGRSDQEAEREELIGPPHQRRNPMRTVHPEHAVRSVLEAAARR